MNEVYQAVSREIHFRVDRHLTAMRTRSTDDAISSVFQARLDIDRDIRCLCIYEAISKDERDELLQELSDCYSQSISTLVTIKKEEGREHVS